MCESPSRSLFHVEVKSWSMKPRRRSSPQRPRPRIRPAIRSIAPLVTEGRFRYMHPELSITTAIDTEDRYAEAVMFCWSRLQEPKVLAFKHPGPALFAHPAPCSQHYLSTSCAARSPPPACSAVRPRSRALSRPASAPGRGLRSAKALCRRILPVRILICRLCLCRAVSTAPANSRAAKPRYCKGA